MIGVVNAKVVARSGALFLVLAATAGCGKSTDASGNAAAGETPSLTGTVRLGEKPLTHGAVAFHLDSGRIVKAVIKNDGSYEVHTPPRGAGQDRRDRRPAAGRRGGRREE